MEKINSVLIKATIASLLSTVVCYILYKPFSSFFVVLSLFCIMILLWKWVLFSNSNNDTLDSKLLKATIASIVCAIISGVVLLIFGENFLHGAILKNLVFWGILFVICIIVQIWKTIFKINK